MQFYTRSRGGRRSKASVPSHREVSSAEVARRVASVEGTIKAVVHHFSVGLDPSAVQDVSAAGWLGATVAAHRYDDADARGASFNTYAMNWVRAYVVREVFFFWSKGRCKIGKATSRIFHQYARTRRALAVGGKKPTFEDVAARLGVSEQMLSDTLATVSAADVTYDDPVHDEGRAVRDVIPDARAKDALEVLCASNQVSDLEEEIQRLDPRSRFVLDQRYREEKTLKEIALVVGVTRERVRQIEVAALARLRVRLARK